MSFIDNRNPDESGFIMNLKCDLGLVSTAVPAWILQRSGLDLADEGVRLNGKIDLFRAEYAGDTVTVDYQCPVTGETKQKVIIENGQVVTGGAGKGSFKGKITALFQDVQNAFGKALQAEEGGPNSGKVWYWSASRMARAMQAHNIARQWRDEYFLPLMQGELYDAASEDFNHRVDSMIAKVRQSLQDELSRTEAAISQTGALDALVKVKSVLEGQLSDLDGVREGLIGKFPSRDKIAESFRVYHTNPKPVPSLVAQVQGSSEAMKALENRLTSEAGAQAAAATIASLNELSGAIPDFIDSLRSELYELVAKSVADLRKIKPDNPTERVKGLMKDHLDRLRVVGEMLSDFGAWASDSEGFNHDQALERIAALSEKLETANPGTVDRAELVQAINCLNAEIAQEVVEANLSELQLPGADTLADMALNIVEESVEVPEEPLSPWQAGIRVTLMEVENTETKVPRLREIAAEFGVSESAGGKRKTKAVLRADLIDAIQQAIAEGEPLVEDAPVAFAMI